jgi:hypothetical protein
MPTVEFKALYEEAHAKIHRAFKNIDGGMFMGISLEVVSKPHLSSDSCVADLFKMLTYSSVCCAFSSACALMHTLIF